MINSKKLRIILCSTFFSTLVILTAMLPAVLGLGRLNLIYSILFFWILFDPERITFSIVIIISLLQDLSNHNYFGSQGILYALFICLIYSQRRHLIKRNFTLLWLVFAVSLSTLLLIKYAWCYLIYHQTISIFEFVIDVVLPVLLLPMMYRIYTFLYMKVFIPNAPFV